MEEYINSKIEDYLTLTGQRFENLEDRDFDNIKAELNEELDSFFNDVKQEIRKEQNKLNLGGIR